MTDKERANTLPPLEWLRVFDAAARTGNFTTAAEQLNLTQAAVSQRIRSLEHRLGISLFTRLPRGVRLTIDGESYAPHVRTALSELERHTNELFGAPPLSLSITASSTVIDRWITPRLSTIQAHFPTLMLTLNTMQTHDDYVQTKSDFDVRFGDGHWPGRHSHKLFDEVLAPVIAPFLMNTGTRAWRELPTIALSGPRTGWLEWASLANVMPPETPTLRFDSFALAVNAAIQGYGVLLGSMELLKPELLSGTLVRVDELDMRMNEGYWLTWPEEQFSSAHHTGLVNALTVQAQCNLCTAPDN